MEKPLSSAQFGSVLGSGSVRLSSVRLSFAQGGGRGWSPSVASGGRLLCNCPWLSPFSSRLAHGERGWNIRPLQEIHTTMAATG